MVRAVQESVNRMSDKLNQSVEWRDLYQTAMLELDASQLESRIDVAIATILLRMEELDHSDGSFGDERRAIADALTNLKTLKRIESRSALRSNAKSHSNVMIESIPVSNPPHYEGGL
jgi:uncharacterized protein HemX